MYVYIYIYIYMNCSEQLKRIKSKQLPGVGSGCVAPNRCRRSSITIVRYITIVMIITTTIY